MSKFNNYTISFTTYPISDGKINPKRHFSGCKAKIQGSNFEDAVGRFSQQQRERGMLINNVVEGDIVNITFIDLDKTDK